MNIFSLLILNESKLPEHASASIVFLLDIEGLTLVRKSLKSKNSPLLFLSSSSSLIASIPTFLMAPSA